MRQARSLDAYLDSADELARLAAHAERLVKLQRVFLEIAPDYLAESSRVANCKSGKIIIHADHGAVAAKLRQMLPSLADELLKRGVQVTEIQVKVQPNHAAPQHGSLLIAPPVSTRAKAGLSRLAGELPAGSELREAVERLVKKSR
jgi:hypothetical protein